MVMQVALSQAGFSAETVLKDSNIFLGADFSLMIVGNCESGEQLAVAKNNTPRNPKRFNEPQKAIENLP
jgi:hypothetical protein